MNNNNNGSRALSRDQKERLVTRPIRGSVGEGTHDGTIDSVDIREVECKFSEAGKRIILNIKVNVEDEDGNEVALYLSPNFNWHSKGKMINILQDLECLPEAGQTLDLEAMVGMKVKVSIENVAKDGIEYSNITSLKKAKENRLFTTQTRIIPTRKFYTEQDSTENDDLFGMEDDSIVED